MRLVCSRIRRQVRTFSVAVLCFLVVIVADHSAIAAGQQSAQRPMSVDDALRLKRLGNVLLSPDGERVFYSVSELDWDENKRRSRYFMVPFSGGEARQYMGDAGGRSFRFSPVGDHLTFLRDVDDEAQVFGLPTDGGEARQLTAHKGGVEAYRWSPDGSALFFSAEETRSDEEQREHDLGHDPVFVDEAPNGKHEARFSNLWVHDIAVGCGDPFDERGAHRRRLRRLARRWAGVVFSARPDDRTNYPFLSELYLYERASGRLTRLTDNLVPEDGPLWAPDGSSFLYRAPSDADFDLRSGYFWIMDVASRRHGASTARIRARSTTSPGAADGTGILFNETRGTDTNLYRLDIGSGEITALTRRQGIDAVTRLLRRPRAGGLFLRELHHAVRPLGGKHERWRPDPPDRRQSDDRRHNRRCRRRAAQWSGKGDMQDRGGVHELPGTSSPANRSH